MFPKLLVVIVTAVVTGAGLVALRHRALETVHDMARIRAEMVRNEQALWELQSVIAERCRPEAIREMLPDETGPDDWAVIPASGVVTADPGPGDRDRRAGG